MAIKKTDRSFEQIVNEVQMHEIPIEYIVNIKLQLVSGKNLVLQQKDIKHIKSTNELLKSVSKEDDIDDMQVVLDYEKIRVNVEKQIRNLFKGHFTEGK
jgi:hypothetical protein|tara:strand:+ start:896 stop:1192 length:297 start_codon:yes stop_codon:yes gene_type:complete